MGSLMLLLIYIWLCLGTLLETWPPHPIEADLPHSTVHLSWVLKVFVGFLFFVLFWCGFSFFFFFFNYCYLPSHGWWKYWIGLSLILILLVPLLQIFSFNDARLLTANIRNCQTAFIYSVLTLWYYIVLFIKIISCDTKSNAIQKSIMPV